MEDEECLPENSSLKNYLQNLGFSDLQVRKTPQHFPPSIRFEVPNPKNKLSFVETIDEDVIDQISIIINTQMLFEEDLSNVEKLLTNFKVVKNGMLKNMFKDFLAVAVIFVGLCLYWFIGNYAFFIVSSFYAYSAADYLRCKHFNKVRLKKLTTILQANFMLLKKTIKFIEENRLIEENNPHISNSAEFMEGFDFYKNFKADFVLSVSEMINVFVRSTQELINKVPLYDYIENPEYYLCNNFNENYNFVNLSKLYEIYLLVQSEFLQRLILSLIPNIKLSNKNGFHDFNKILTETCVSLLKIKNKLNRKFRFLFINGIHSPKAKVEFKLPIKSKPGNSYLNEFIFNIHETSKTLQNLLLKCRTLEENLMSDNIPKYVDQELVKIQTDMDFCQRNIADSFILLKKANASEGNFKTDNVNIQEEDEVKNSTENLNKIMVGYTDLDPKIEDEIFEAYFANDNSGRLDADDWNLEEKLDKKLEKEFCRNVMKELKLKLVEKAKYWRKRERELLQKKGLIDENNVALEDEDIENTVGDGNVDDDAEKPLINDSMHNKMPLKYQKMLTNSKTSISELENLGKKEEEELETIKTVVQTISCPENENLKHTELAVTSEDISDSLNRNSETVNTHEEDPVQCFNKGFLNDLNVARQKIFKSTFQVQEELFCASGEESSSESEPT